MREKYFSGLSSMTATENGQRYTDLGKQCRLERIKNWMRVETVKCDECGAINADRIALRDEDIYVPRAMIRSIDVRKVIQSAEHKPSARLERWAARQLQRRISEAEARAELQRFIELD